MKRHRFSLYLPVAVCIGALTTTACVTINHGPAVQWNGASQPADADACGADPSSIGETETIYSMRRNPRLIRLRYESCQIQHAKMALIQKRNNAAEIAGANLGIAYAFLDAKTLQYARREQEVALALKEAEEQEAREQAAQEEARLAQLVATKEQEYDDAANAGPQSSACQRAKENLEDARNAQQLASQVTSFIPGAGNLNSIVNKAGSALSKLELAVGVYCVFDAARAGNAQQALLQVIDMYQANPLSGANPGRKQRLAQLAKKLRGGR